MNIKGLRTEKNRGGVREQTRQSCLHMRAIIITPGSSRKVQDDCHHEQKDSHQALLLSRQHACIDLDLSIKLCADNAQSRENTPPPRHRPHSMSSSDDGFGGGDCASDDPRCSPGASCVPLLLPRNAPDEPGADCPPDDGDGGGVFA